MRNGETISYDVDVDLDVLAQDAPKLAAWLGAKRRVGGAAELGRARAQDPHCHARRVRRGGANLALRARRRLRGD